MNKLTVHKQNGKIVMQDEQTGETAILESQQEAVTNFASWLYARKLSGKTIVTDENRGRGRGVTQAK